VLLKGYLILFKFVVVNAITRHFSWDSGYLTWIMPIYFGQIGPKYTLLSQKCGENRMI